MANKNMKFHKNKLFNIWSHNISSIIIILINTYPTFWNIISLEFNNTIALRYFIRIINGNKFPHILAGNFNINIADKIRAVDNFSMGPPFTLYFPSIHYLEDQVSNLCFIFLISVTINLLFQ